MTAREFNRHISFLYAKQHRFIPTIKVTSRRQAKSMKNGYGQILRNSRVVGEINLERDNQQHKSTKY